MDSVMMGALVAGGCLAAAALGWQGGGLLRRLWQAASYRRLALGVNRRSGRQDEGAGRWLPGSTPSTRGRSVADRVLDYGMRLSRRVGAPTFRAISPLWLRNRPCPADKVRWAGLERSVTADGFWETRVRLAILGTAVGFGAGFVLSAELGLLLAGAGALAGWKAMPWALDRRCEARADGVERELSEMLDVVALGLRSGLSFERSLELYLQHFTSSLAASFSKAMGFWDHGLMSREEALRAVAATYDSPLLARVVENIVRSLRFGSALAESLEDAAREARCSYKAKRQEAVAKAPVKMMVPTTVLMLPAMLILVLGPVLLELAGGF